MGDTPMSDTKWEKERAKKRAAMILRLSSLGKDNPIVSKAIKSQQPMNSDLKYKSWEVVDELVSAARREYFDKEDGSMKDCLLNLGKALTKLSSKSPIDNGKSKVQNKYVEDEDED